MNDVFLYKIVIMNFVNDDIMNVMIMNNNESWLLLFLYKKWDFCMIYDKNYDNDLWWIENE